MRSLGYEVRAEEYQRKMQLAAKTRARIKRAPLPTNRSTTRHHDWRALRTKALLKSIEKTGLDTGILYMDASFSSGTVVNRALELVTAATEKKLQRAAELDPRAIESCTQKDCAMTFSDLQAACR